MTVLKAMGVAWFWMTFLPLAWADGTACQPGMVSVDQQCVSVGNQVDLVFLQVFSVHKGYTVLPGGGGGQTRVEVVGRGYSNHLGGTTQSPIPMTVSFLLKDDAFSKNDRPMAHLGTCQQAALLSMSSKEKYLFSVGLHADHPLQSQLISGGNGKFEIRFETVSGVAQIYTLQCGNSLKAP
jgi:hypothetical protein